MIWGISVKYRDVGEAGPLPMLQTAITILDHQRVPHTQAAREREREM